MTTTHHAATTGSAHSPASATAPTGAPAPTVQTDQPEHAVHRVRTRVFTGLKPTGSLQMGNYLGAIRPLLDLAADPTNEVIVSVVDLHALTVDHDPALLRERTFEMAATLLACGLDTNDSTRLFVQSSLSEHTDLHYLLESVATYGEMHRMVQFKEKSGIVAPDAEDEMASKADLEESRSRQASVRLSLLTYPSLMAADILAHASDVVPVGADQKQHLELARTVAGRFNRRYGPVFTIPEGRSPIAGARLKDLRDPTAKMGKSGAEAAGVLHLLDGPDVLAAKVRRATTDADPVLSYDPLGRPGVTNLAVLLGALTGADPRTVLDGLHGSGSLKVAVTEALVETLAPIRSAYADIRADESTLRALLREGAEAVRPRARETVAAAREAMGLLTV